MTYSSSGVTAGTNATASQYNNLRTDTLGLYLTLLPENFILPSSSFPEFKNNVGTNKEDFTLDFDESTQETVHARIFLPTELTISASTTATAYVTYRMASATSGNVVWQLVHHTAGDNEAWDTAGTTDNFSASSVPGTAGQVKTISKALTVTSWGANEMLHLKFARKAADASDTASGDAKFMSLYLRIY